MKATQKIRQANITKWSALFHDQAASGLTIKEWCSQNNVSIHAYYYWKRIARESFVDSIIPEIVPVCADPPPVPLPEHTAPALIPNNLSNLYDSRNSTCSDSVLISLGDIRIEIGVSASDEIIAAIIKAVRHA